MLDSSLRICGVGLAAVALLATAHAEPSPAPADDGQGTMPSRDQATRYSGLDQINTSNPRT